MTYANSMDSILKPICSKTKVAVEDLCDYVSFKEKWDAAAAALVEERASERAAVEVANSGADMQPDGADDDPVRTANPAKYQANSLQYWKAFASQYVRQYVRLMVQPESARGVADVVAGSEANNVRATEGKSTVIIMYDQDCSCEALCRPMERKPPLDEGNLKNLLQGALAGRGGQRNQANEVVCGTWLAVGVGALLLFISTKQFGRTLVGFI